MARYAYDRLSAQDASFLLAERPNQPMHVGGLAVLEAGPLRTMVLHLAAACAWSFGFDRQRVASWLRGEAAQARVKR